MAYAFAFMRPVPRTNSGGGYRDSDRDLWVTDWPAPEGCDAELRLGPFDTLAECRAAVRELYRGDRVVRPRPRIAFGPSEDPGAG